MILIVNTSERTGGAAVAANRLMKALNKNGTEARMLVNDKKTDDKNVFEVPGKWRKRHDFLYERLLIVIRNGFSKKRLFEIDPAYTGTDITKLPCFKEADVIHLHWINQGMLAMKDLRKILTSGKPVVWTMHDQWCSTGICHSTGECTKFQTHCAGCPLLQTSRRKDLSWTTFEKKKALFARKRLTFVTCSRWLKDIASSGMLLGNQKVINIPNPIDTEIFMPRDKNGCRQELALPQGKRLILVGAVNMKDYRKGPEYMAKAVNTLLEDTEFARTTEVICIGNGASDMKTFFHCQVHAFDYVKEEALLSKIYSAADFFLTPSLYENLPNMIMEAMACGIPCIGFNVGGIPEMIDHGRNGYVAEYKSTEDLVRGLKFLLGLPEESYRQYSENSRKKVLDCYSEAAVARQYDQAYRQAAASMGR